jgi:hypothetical protein
MPIKGGQQAIQAAPITLRPPNDLIQYARYNL